MVEIEQVGPDDWKLVRDVRLTALQDTPDWFWATYEDEVEQPENWWREFIGSGGWFIAKAGDDPVAIAAGIRDPLLGDATRYLISMWVEPGTRRSGVGVQLIDAVVAWARADGAKEIRLQVTETNDVAARLYAKCGFEPTGRTEPLPRNPTLVERELRLVL